MSRVSKRLIGRLVVLGLATSVSALVIALGTADVALAKGGGGGGGGPSGGGGHGWGGGGGHGWGGAAHFSGGHHFSASHISHASHWSGGHHYTHVTHYSGHTHATGIHTHTTNLSHSNLSHNNLSHTNHELTKTGEEKNLNSHVTPLKNASDPKNFGSRRDFSNKTAFNSFWRGGLAQQLVAP